MYVKNPCYTTESRYKNYRNKLNHLLRISERRHVAQYLDKYKGNAQKTWSLINEILNKKTCNKLPDEIKCNGGMLTDNKDIANSFNEYFTNVGTKLANKINTNVNPMTFMKDRVYQSMYVKSVGEKELVEIIDNLKNGSAGWDGIKASVIKSVKNEILPILLYLVNLSLETGVFPNMLKIATVTPIHKKGPKDDVSNYRPISVLPVVSKIFERIMCNRIVHYFETFNILYEHQYGFRKGYSTDLALVSVIDDVLKALEDKEIVLAIYMDLAKAFDTVSHDILLEKLKLYGICGPAYL
jgi:hypothetical protein